MAFGKIHFHPKVPKAKVRSHQYFYPDAIYKALPFFYVSAGLLTALWLRNWIAVLSGLIMISAGGVVWSMRYSHRRSFAQSSAPTPVEPSAGKLLEISWKASFKCGNAVIDDQHKKLFMISNELVDALASYETKLEIDERLIKLIDHITHHFCTEEALMAEAKIPLLVEHQEHHAALLSKVKSLREGYLNNQVGAGELLGFIAYDVIVSHILKEDSKWLASKER